VSKEFFKHIYGFLMIVERILEKYRENNRDENTP